MPELKESEIVHEVMPMSLSEDVAEMPAKSMAISVSPSGVELEASEIGWPETFLGSVVVIAIAVVAVVWLKMRKKKKENT